MKWIIILVCFIISACSIVKENTGIESLEINSISLRIEKITSCTDSEESYISARSYKGKFLVRYFNDTLELVQRYEVDSAAFVNAIDSFEIKKNKHNGCGGYGGGMGYYIHKEINGEKASDFGYCLWGNNDECNGLEYFYSQFEKIEID